MTAGWVSTASTLIPLALVIALSPLTVIPAVLVLHAPRPRPTSLAFLGGWLLSLAALTVLFVVASDALGGVHKTPPSWASWLRVILGLALIGFGVFRWFTQQKHGEPPRWLRVFTSITPLRAGITGAVLAVRPEVLILSAAAGLAIGTSRLGTAETWLCAIFFVVIAVSSVAAPILAYAGVGDRLDDSLERLKEWMERHHGALLAITLIVIGLMVLYNGIHALYQVG